MIKPKSDMRISAQARRAALDRAGFAAAVSAYAAQLDLAADAVIAGYLPMGDEADPRGLMTALAARGHDLALPRIAAKAAPIVFHRWREGDAMVTHKFGMSEPHGNSDVLVPNVLLVPLLAFDGGGYRLGYGGGFYDRTLEALRAVREIRAIGIAYAGQEVQAVPHDAHDQRLDAVLTENGLQSFTRHLQ